MKIGVLTMNYAQNYGGVLQSYGLLKYLEKLEHDVEIINYRNSGVNSIGSIVSKMERRLKSESKPAQNKLPKRPLTEKYLQNFKDFKTNQLSYTSLTDENDISRICSDFDVVIVGSDQIWNDVYTNKLAYYFDWEFSGKKIAYAACTILEQAPASRRHKLKRLLNGFDKITVRDNNTANYVRGLINITPDLVVDPSCLHNYSEFIGANPIGKPYILTYILSGEISGSNRNAIQLIKQNMGDISVVSVCIPSVSVAAQSISDIMLEEATPIDWVNLFYHASFVYTDSFHGIMFSMKYQRPFIAYMKDGQRKSRLQDLIDRYNLGNIVTNVNQIPQVLKNGIIDYSVVGPKLTLETERSISILNSAIND